MSEAQRDAATTTRSSLDDDCPTCGHRLLRHPRTLVEIPSEPGYYEWAYKLCDGTVLRVISGTARAPW